MYLGVMLLLLSSSLLLFFLFVCFHILNCDAWYHNKHKMDSFLDTVAVSFRCVQEVGLLGHLLSFLHSLLAIVASMVPRNSFFLPHPLGDCHSDHKEITPHCGLTCTSQMITGVEHQPVGHLYVFFGATYIQVLCPLFSGLFV